MTNDYTLFIPILQLIFNIHNKLLFYLQNIKDNIFFTLLLAFLIYIIIFHKPAIKPKITLLE